MPDQGKIDIENKSTKPISLAELIEAVKADLSAPRPTTDTPALFKVTEAEVEVAVTFTRNVELGGKLTVWVAEIGPKVSESTQAAQRIKLKLVPNNPSDVRMVRGTGPNDGMGPARGDLRE